MVLFLGNGVTITVNGTHSIVKVSQADPTVSGETTPSAYTMTQGTDYTMTYTPTGSNQGIEDRTVTVTITGIGKFSGQTKTVTYTQKADPGCTTASTCTPSTSITYSNYSVSYVGGAVACNGTPSKSNITVTADKTTTTKDVFCQESSTTDNDVSITDFSVSYSPSGNNTGTSNRTVTGTVTHNGSTAGTFTFTQNSGSTCQPTPSCMTIRYTLTQGAAGTVYFKTTNGTQEATHYVDATGSQSLCNVAEGTTLVVTHSNTAVTVGGDTSFVFTDGGEADISLTLSGTGSTTCDCTTISISCSPTTTSTTGNSVSTTVTVTGGTNCGTTWKAYNSLGTYITSGSSGSKFSSSTVGTYTIRSSECTAKTATFTINQGSINYEYTFTNCYDDRQIALFASNATPSGSHTQYAMLSAMDGTTATVIVNSTGGTSVNGSSSNNWSTAYIGDSVKVYSVTTSNSSWSLLETITLTAENRSFSYGNCTQVSCILGTTATSTGGTGSTVTIEQGKSTTVTIYSKDESGRCTTTPTRTIGNSNIVSSVSAGTNNSTSCYNTWTITAGNTTGSTNITFSNGCATFVIPVSVTAATSTNDYYFSFSDTSLVTTSSITIDYPNDEVFSVTLYSCYGSGYDNGTAVGYTISSTPTLDTGPLQTNGCEQGDYFDIETDNGGLVGTSGSITFTQNTSGKKLTLNWTADTGTTNPCMNYIISNTTDNSVTVRVYVLGGSYDESIVVPKDSTSSSMEICNLSDDTTISVSKTSGDGDLNISSFKFKGGDSITIEVNEKTLTSTTYSYELVANNMEACDTTTTGTVYYTPKYHYSDGSTSNGTRTQFTGNVTLSYKYQADTSSAYASTLSTNENNHALDVNVKATFTHNNSVQEPIDIIQQDAGPCSTPTPTGCTTSNTWSSISVTANTVGECATSGSFTVKANGTHTYTDCSTATTSATLTSSYYTVKYGTTNGTYTLDNIISNETTSTKTWYYKITASSTYGSKTKTGSFTQEAGPCTPVVTLTCNPLDMSYVDSSKTMTATFEEMVASDVTINFKLNLSNSNSVSDSITISEGNNSGSKTLSTSQSITSTAGTSVEITSISPTEDSEYEYNCDTGYTITPSEAAPSYEFSVSTSSIVIDDWVYGQGGFVYVKSRKNGSKLSVSNSSSDFITVSATTNDNSSYDYKYLIIVEANNGTSYRDGSITFTQSETNDTETISVRQVFNPYVNVTFTPNFTDGNITVASDFNAYYKEYGETVNYGAGNGDDDGNWTITWSHTPTYSGNAGTYNVLIYYWDYATVCGQTITVSACYKGGSHGNRCGNDSGTGPTYTPVTPQPSEPSIVTKDGYLQIYNPLSYAVIVYVQHYINGAASGSIISRTVQARSYEQLGWPATGTPTHGAVITSWEEA